MLQVLLDIETVFPQEPASMQTIIGGTKDNRVIAVIIQEVQEVVLVLYIFLNIQNAQNIKHIANKSG